MQDYVHKIKALIEERKVKLSDLSESTEIPYRTLQDNLSKNKGFSVENLKKICTFLRVSMDGLFVETDSVCSLDVPYKSETLPLEEQELLRRFRCLDPKHKNNILEMMAGYEALSEGQGAAGSAESGSGVRNLKRRSTD